MMGEAYNEMISLCSKVLELDAMQMDKYRKTRAKEIRKLFTDMKKIATEAKRDSLKRDKQ